MLLCLLGDNGILNKVQNAKEDNSQSSAKEKLKLKINEIFIIGDGKAKLSYLNNLNNEESAIYDTSFRLEKEITEDDLKAKVILDGYVFTVNNEYKIENIEKIIKKPFEDNLLVYSSFDENTSIEDKASLNTIQVEPISSINLVNKEEQIGSKSVYFASNSNSNSNRLIEKNGDLNFGVNDFTIEFWANAENQVNTYPVFCSDNDNSKLQFFISDASCSGNISLAIGYPQARVINTGKNYISTVGIWTHYAITRKDGIFVIFQNGKKIGETADYKTTNIDLTNFSIGGNAVGTTGYKGYLDDFSIYGRAKYISEFTPLKVNIDNQNRVLYIDFEDTIKSFSEQINNNNYTVIGNMFNSRNNKKFGLRSIYFPADSSFDRIKIVNNKLNFGTKDFTIEFWANAETQINNYPAFLSDENNSKLQFFISDISYSGNITLAVGYPQARIINTGKKYSNTVGKWTHYAVVRQNGVFTIYQDGKNIGTTDIYKTINVDLSELAIGGNAAGTTAYKGNIDDFTIYNIAKYTGEFIVSATPNK